MERNLKVFDTLDFDVFSNQKWDRLHETHGIQPHPVRFGSGSWTAVTGVMTGRRFAIGMATIGHWKSGKIDHEWLFWDNQDFMDQIGLGGK